MTTPASEPGHPAHSDSNPSIVHPSPSGSTESPSAGDASGQMNFPLPPLSMVNPIVIVVALAVIAAGLSAWAGHLLFALWFLLGGLLAIGNAKLVILKVGSATSEENPRKAPVAVNAAFRLGVVTVIALAVAYFFRPDGLGLIFGLAVGQIVLVLHSVIPVLKGLRTQS
ncbi:ATP synthase subunit I [Tsukamurella soli]|uniref:ATP synthase I chain n=1 Tax=Tsukamurella soli TaxID=644556 RepID=A0ABP8K4G2_9ACTN